MQGTWTSPPRSVAARDATRCALNGHCYWTLRNEGQSATAASRALLGMSASRKNELLFERGINFNELPSWQRRGTGIYWETVLSVGRNPKTGAELPTQRRRLKVDEELPMKEAYSKLIRGILVDPRDDEGASG